MPKKMNQDERRQALISHSLDYYLVDYADGTSAVREGATELQAITACGADPSKYGISQIRQCWNGEDLGES
jgi:hypothetical protein